jgi:uncharacterized protein (TIGR02147 family)
VETGEAVHIFRYLDYRAFLRDFYVHEKARNTRFSHRLFSRRAGLRSSNYLNLVMKGERDLSAEMATRFARGCSLRKVEADYFCELVAFGQARTADERNRCYDRLGRFREFRAAHQLDAEQAAYHASWYMPAIRELVARPDFQEDPKWIASVLLPPISPQQAREALSTLCSLRLLLRDEAGRLRQAEELVTTGQGPLGHHVVNYHRTMIGHAVQALDHVPREERDISSLTLCVSEAALPRLKERIRAFRQELLQFAELEGQPERVVQVNFQLFPLSAGKGNVGK